MVQINSPQGQEVIYPDSDGKPMADNTKQFRWIVTIKENLETLFSEDANVFIAGDLLWYPVEGDNKTRIAPDAMVVFGRPKGDRGSYQQWREDNLPPQVVFEILSPGNTRAEMSRKLLFYDRFGVEEYYEYDPDRNILNGWIRTDGFLNMIDSMRGWVSPRLAIRFEPTRQELQIYFPDGERFLTHTEISEKADRAEEIARQERDRADRAEEIARQERDRADRAEEKADRLAAQLRELGVEFE
ncbi:MAG: hypothetical protein N5P05_000262 [Chroococcopsis gigantea SAG 12.99]|jgi:Uma2 family endonuclease|nr:hypothetical protein [Chroococcopsis gigantea SAG 12.99]